MKCRECGSEMYIDDKDFNFRGNYDLYWSCSVCITSCIEEFRHSYPVRQLWHSENNDIVKDYNIIPD